ncbi:MAG: hypothetical protein KDJ99_06030 [Candidatus Competibacteraceae bacterium]|nr:hypothetical protein [Candidatus Competibacteraceae bacterium]
MIRIDALFLRFSARYQRAWTTLFPTPEAYAVAVTEWDFILTEVSDDGIERALQRCLAEFPTFPPKPAEFLALTRPTPAELGLPSLDEAYQAAIAQRWRAHPLVWHVVMAIGPYEFRRLSQDQARQRFGAVYQHVLDWIIEQRQRDPAFTLQFPALKTPRLTHDQPKKVTAPGDARVHLAAIRKKLQQRQPSDKRE